MSKEYEIIGNQGMGFNQSKIDTCYDEYRDGIARRWITNSHEVTGVLQKVDFNSGKAHFAPCITTDMNGFAYVSEEAAVRDLPIQGYNPLPPGKTLQDLANENNQVEMQKLEIIKNQHIIGQQQIAPARLIKLPWER